MKLFRFIFYYVVLTTALVGMFPLNATAGFGVSPGTIEENKLVPGATLERIIYLVQGNPTEDLAVRATVESPDAKEWITFKNGDTFTIPAGQQQYPMPVTIRVPENASLGIYRAFIQVNTIPHQVEGSQITIALGGRINVLLTVGDNLISEFSVKSIEIFDIRESQKPRVGVTVTNTGNVPAAPDAASFELFNKFGNIRLAYGENSKFTKVPAFDEKTTTLEFPLDVKLAVGEYWGHVKIYSNGEVIKELRTVFNVTPSSFFEKNVYSIAAVVIVLLAIIFVVVRRRSRRRRR